MEQWLGNTRRTTVNERKFIEMVLSSGLRMDGRDIYDYRKLSVKFGRQRVVACIRTLDTSTIALDDRIRHAIPRGGSSCIRT